MSNDHGGGGGIVIKARESTTERKSQATGKKRGNSIFTTMSVAPADDEDDDDDDDDDREADVGSGGNRNRNLRVCHAERVLVNGDFYTGQWADNLPHGLGKYLWTDGCMYVGEWSRGKTTGKGCFTWPSGATYEGEFMSGYMDGKGTYTGSSGDTYRGGWIMNLKHGHGTKSYVNGDCYDGEWRRGVQEGHGRYQWRRGNHYIGHWKSGAIHGNGTMIWTNGNRFDGSWEDGLPKGNGTLRWADGSFYVGVWSTDPKEQSGTYYPPGSSVTGNSDWDPQEIFSVELRDCRICPGDNITILPSQKILTWPGFEGDLTPPPHQQQQQRRRDLSKEAVKDSSHRPRRRSVDGRISLGTERGCHGWDSDDIAGGRGDLYGRHSTATCLPGTGSIMSLLSEDSESNRGGGRQPLRIQPTKKQGETISKGHKNYELMLNLQLGIRHSVGRPAPATSLDLKASAFDPKEKVWTKFPPEGSKHTPPHQSCDFRWKDYCPLVFRTLRKLFEVDAADYMLSICGNDALRELSSPGKSGSFFYLTNDDQYMIKTMKKAEVKVLLRMLPAYYNHVRAYEHTLVTKFFGLHCVKLTGTAQKKVRFVIMGNLFCTDYAIHRRFDLKGSSHGRTTDKPDAELDATTTLKDLDLNFIFRLQKDWFQELCRQVDRDCDFLEQERIMDYSLLVGLHFRELVETSPVEGSRSGARTPTGNGDSEGDVAPPPRLSVSQLPFDPARWATKRLGINMAARVEQTVRRNDYEQLVGEPTGELYEVILFFGIIDILQDYDISKKLEHAYKSIQYDPTSISAVDPRQYSKRFRDFVFKVFAEDT